MKSAKDIQQMLIETINTKLRYEQIIQNIQENERIGLNFTVSEIIKSTKLVPIN
jgi:hypothetical protein